MNAVISFLKDAIQCLLARIGYRLMRLESQTPQAGSGALSILRDIPEQARQRLRTDDPRLLELRRRYTTTPHPAVAHSQWTKDFVAQNLDLGQFRGDNAYIWQARQASEVSELRYFIYTEYVQSRDARGLLTRTQEDGLFGCCTFRFEGRPLVSRDLLDSLNEIYFLDRQIGLFSIPELRVLDIGAGYGRLAHRMSQTVPNLKAYACVDAVPESTFLCEYYLEYRGIAQPQACAVPLDELDRLDGLGPFNLALNIHSFTECPYVAIEFWIRKVADLRIRWLLIAPNMFAGSQHDLFSTESDGSRKDFSGLLSAAGYRLALRAPKFDDPYLQNTIPGIAGTEYYLYERSA